MQNIKNLEADKVTYAAYYQALMKCKDAAETQNWNRNGGFNRSSTEGRKSNPTNPKLPPRQTSPFQAVSGIMTSSGALDTSDWLDENFDNNPNQIKLSQVLENSLYLEL